MPRRRRLCWAAAPIAFFATYRVALHLYWLPERQAFIQKHGATAAAFGDGKLDAVASAATLPYIVALAVLMFILPRITFIRGLLLGAITALLMLAITSVFGTWAASHLPRAVARYGPTVTSAFIIILLAKWLARRTQAPLAAAA